MKKCGKTLIMVVMAATLAVSASLASADALTDVLDDFAATCQAPKKAIQELAPWLKLSADLRLRWVYQENAGLVEGTRNASGHHNDDRSWSRIRARVGACIHPPENIEVNVRLVDEFRHVSKPVGGLNRRYRRDTKFDEVTFDK